MMMALFAYADSLYAWLLEAIESACAALGQRFVNHPERKVNWEHYGPLMEFVVSSAGVNPIQA
jgi:hypothetical protein